MLKLKPDRLMYNEIVKEKESNLRLKETYLMKTNGSCIIWCQLTRISNLHCQHLAPSPVHQKSAIILREQSPKIEHPNSLRNEICSTEIADPNEDPFEGSD